MHSLGGFLGQNTAIPALSSFGLVKQVFGVSGSGGNPQKQGKGMQRPQRVQSDPKGDVAPPKGPQ